MEDPSQLAEVAHELAKACRLALHSFEDGWAIDWAVLSRAIAKYEIVTGREVEDEHGQ